jgi:hypothetical protein
LIDEIHESWAKQYNRLERHHGYIQWLFPIHEDGMNWDAQVLQRHEAETMKSSKEIMARVIRSYKMMLGFYGAELVSEETGELRRASNFSERFQNLNTFGHNYLRITRILKFLGEMDLEHLKLPFLTFFIKEVLVHKHVPNCQESLLYFWVPTLRNDDDLKACYRYFENPDSTPPVSVLLTGSAIASSSNPAREDARQDSANAASPAAAAATETAGGDPAGAMDACATDSVAGENPPLPSPLADSESPPAAAGRTFSAPLNPPAAADPVPGDETAGPSVCAATSAMEME